LPLNPFFSIQAIYKLCFIDDKQAATSDIANASRYRFIYFSGRTTMNTKQLTAALILLTAASAATAEAPYPPETKFVSTKTRAEVIAELKQAQAQHLIASDYNYPIVIQARSPLPREQAVSAVNSKLYSGA
jgi:hypothetical protein